jgi:RNA polymerase sigma-70 factor (ECF subfamily)
MRLALQLIENEQTNLPDVNALMALMCFHSSRFAARKNEYGEIILYRDQDENLWNKDLIAKGALYLKLASTGNRLSKYHLEAGIAYWHTKKEDSQEKWDNILQLYNKLLQINYSPVAALHRNYAFSKVYGKEKAIIEAEKLKLTDNHFYFLLLGELYKNIDNVKSIENFERAMKMARTAPEKQVIQGQIDTIRNSNAR